ncbi:DUF4114 domain-containing protein [Desmonostoc muscorum CCALA 125]|nr:DUF4114 domain-containing protein [Desmonostoc muscorum CCALA 125]
MFSTGNAFAALKADGSVVTWGYSNYGGDSSAVSSQLTSGVINISSPFDPIGLIVAENSPTNTAIGTFSSVDPDTGDTFTYSLVSGTGSTDNNSFTINGNQLLINASPNFEAKSSYSIRVRTTDQTNSSYEKAFTISISNVNDPPTLQAVTPANLINTPADDTFTDITGILVGADDDIDTNLVYGITDGNVTGNTSTLIGNYGTLSLDTQTGAYTYTPNATAINALTTNASDNFTFSVSDGSLSATQPFAVNITDVNHPPTLQAVTPANLINTPANDTFTDITGTLVGADDDIGTKFVYGIIGGNVTGNTSTLTGNYGTLSLDTQTGAYTYTPNATAIDALTTNASDNFTFSVSDGSLSTTQPFAVNITVANDANHPPTLQAVTPANLINTPADDTFTDITGILVGADDDIDTKLVYDIIGGNVTGNTSTLTSTYGTLSLDTQTGAYTYTPNATAIDALTTNASDNFTFSVSDGSLSATQPFAVNITGADDTPTTTVVDAKFINSTNDIFKIDASEFTKVNIKIKIKGRSSKLVNELGVFSVDDSLGTIDGIAPGVAGYQEKALSRAKIIFSVITNNPTGFNQQDLSRILELQGGTQLRFYLKSQSKIIFSDTTTQKITSQSGGGFTLGWKDGSRGDSVFDDLQVNIQQTDEQLPIGTSLQGESEGEALDLRDFGTDSLISGTFIVNREASYNNFVGFYEVTDEEGGIDTNGDGTADILPGQAGYAQAAIKSRMTDIALSVGNQGTGNHNGNFQGGGIYVPFLIVDGRVDALLDSNSSNDPTVYFTFLGANADKTQHVKMLGDNVFGFEDLSGGGDKDYNDVIVKINLTHNIT